jgi:hypothetical protein
MYAIDDVARGRYSRNQEVCMSKKGDWSTVWEVQYLDPQFKMEMEGQPVPTNAPVAIIHCATRQYTMPILLSVVSLCPCHMPFVRKQVNCE